MRLLTKTAAALAIAVSAVGPAMAYNCNNVSFSAGVNDLMCQGGFSPPPNDSVEAVDALTWTGYEPITVNFQYKDDNSGAGSSTFVMDAVGTGLGTGTIDWNTTITDRFVLVLKLGNEWSAYLFDTDVNPSSNWTFTLANATGGTGLSHAAVYTVAAIPEPSTYALMFAGLAAVGFMARRRRQS